MFVNKEFPIFLFTESMNTGINPHEYDQQLFVKGEYYTVPFGSIPHTHNSITYIPDGN